MKTKLLIGLFFLLFCACHNNSDNHSNVNGYNLNSIEELLSDTFKEVPKQPVLNEVSIEKILLRNLKLNSINEIKKMEETDLSKLYLDLFKMLDYSKDSSKSEQNLILFAIFDALNKKQTELEETTEIEIKTKLQLARIKSKIWPYFKK